MRANVVGWCELIHKLLKGFETNPSSRAEQTLHVLQCETP